MRHLLLVLVSVVLCTGLRTGDWRVTCGADVTGYHVESYTIDPAYEPQGGFQFDCDDEWTFEPVSDSHIEVACRVRAR